MNKQPQTIQNILAGWGQSKQVPQPNDNIKNIVLNSLPVNSNPVAARRPAMRWWVPVATVGLSALVLIFFVSHQRGTPTISTPGYVETFSADDGSKTKEENSSGVRMDQSSAGTSTGSAMDKAISSFVNPTPPEAIPLPYYQPEIPITDTRQFLKTDYSAAIRTRQPQELTTRIQTMVRGYEGRVDSASSSDKYGSAAFVIPATKLDSFRAELSQLAGSRFIIEQTSAQNMLPQKQAIEQNRNDAQTHLTGTTAKRDGLTADHNKKISDWQAKLNTNASLLASLQTKWNKYPDQRTQIEQQQRQAQQERASLNGQLTDENNNYQTQLNSLNAQIQSLEQALKNANQQDTQLTDSVATVRGTISLTKINIWQFINTYLPDYWVLYAAILAALTAYILHRRRFKWVI